MIYDESMDDVLLRERRFRMVEEQLRLRSIYDKRILESVKKVPRHLFLDEQYWNIAYADHPVPLGRSHSLPQPYLIGLMMQALEIRPQHKVLEIGTGTGYQSALMAEIASQVFSIDHHQAVYESAKSRLKEYGYRNIKCSLPKKCVGWPTQGPFDRILLVKAARCIPKELLKQMSSRSIMVMPVGNKGSATQEVVKVTRNNDTFSCAKIAQVSGLPFFQGHKMTPADLEY